MEGEIPAVTLLRLAYVRLSEEKEQRLSVRGKALSLNGIGYSAVLKPCF